MYSFAVIVVCGEFAVLVFEEGELSVIRREPFSLYSMPVFRTQESVE
jgi:hypothetical protein